MKKKILFVDDDVRRMETYAEMLSVEGYQVTLVGTVKDAENYFMQNSDDISLVVLDIVMPYKHSVGEDILKSRNAGIELLRKIRLIKSKEQLPVVVLSVVSNGRIKKEAFEEGCNVYLEKPCLPSALLRRIQENLEIVV
jgi:DNA-binding response OmpR family regulator